MSAQATSYLRLPFAFDLARLQQDLSHVQDQRWIAHYNNQAHEKDWRCLPLRSVSGRSDDIDATDNDDFLDTPLLQQCPYFRQVLDSLACEKTSIRLMSLEAGGRILPHRDAGGGFEDGVARLHLPIITTPEVLFTIDDEVIHFAAGALWYMNANCRHAVHNASAVERIHLVIDCVPNAWLEQVFSAAGWRRNAAPKYGDPSITEQNVGTVIAQLKSIDHPCAQEMAAKLQQIQQQGELAAADAMR